MVIIINWIYLYLWLVHWQLNKRRKEKNEYNLKLITDPISPNARSIYISLLDLNNKLGWKEKFSIANSRLMETSGIESRATFHRARKELIDNGYILYEKGKNNILVGFYKIISLKSQNCETALDLEPVGLESSPVTECEQNANRMRTECELPVRPLNKLNKTKLNKTFYLYKKNIKDGQTKNNTPYPDTEHGNVLSTKTDISISDTEEEKVKYRDNVLLTKKEYETLLSEHGKNKLNKILDLLHFYKLSQDKTYKSDYGAINTWVVSSIEEKEQKAQAKAQKAPYREERNFNPEELDSLME